MNNVKHAKVNVPYTTPSGLKIGLLYLPPIEYKPDYDAVCIQSVLLKADQPRMLGFLRDLLY